LNFHQLLSNRANVNLKTDFGSSALSVASKNGHVNILKVLLHFECDLDGQDETGATALHRAIPNESTEAAKILIDL
jgi:ankyrin repeat protein